MEIRSALSALRNGGASGFSGYLQDRWWSRKDRTRIVRDLGDIPNFRETSISDAGLYPSFCRLASTDDAVFARFRRSLIYRSILEHVSRKQGLAYLREIEATGSMMQHLGPLLASDFVGSPVRFTYPAYGKLSPTTLRYIKVAADLQWLFGSLSGLRVAEIGIGYGGQCRVLATLWPDMKYTLFDIPEALGLARRFLNASEIDQANVLACDGRGPAAGEFDLVISNYAFSELQRELQEDYWDNVIRGCRMGYFTYNHISPREWGSLSADELAKRIPGSTILEERPLTHPDNVIVAWGVGSL